MKKMTVIALAFVLSLTLLVPAFADQSFKIGIAQFAVHGSLDNCREGFLMGLKEEGFEEGKNLVVDVQNAQADMGMAAQIASGFVANQYDLICAIATPMAVTCHKTADDKIPVIYSAVSAPVEAELADKNGLGIGNVSGTSDELPVKQQLEMIRALLPNAKTIGILYTVSEVNSQIQLAEYQKQAPDYGFTIEATAINVGADIALAVPSLISKVDCITMLLDNTVVQYLDVVLEATDKASLPVFGSEIEQVVNGCVASEGIDYIKLGKQTGKIAARVLKGEEAGKIPYELSTECALYINSEVMTRLGITLPESLAAGATDVKK